MGGLTARINRHLRKEKKFHWHIDYLLKHSSIINIITGENNDGSKYQCRIARILIKNLDCIKGFGCSDCKCSSHLFFSPKKKIILKHVLTAFNGVGVQMG
ncbi:MAG: GIY-YIG nuclease family protein [Desulfosarcina sp.]|nr:GIY-YIG nuclease family protein [Desulfobacterales bacterium]